MVKIQKLKIKKKVIKKKEKKTDAVKKRKPAAVDCIDSECFAKHFATIHLTVNIFIVFVLFKSNASNPLMEMNRWSHWMSNDINPYRRKTTTKKSWS